MSPDRVKRTATLAGALILCLGGGRLAVNEIQLASEQARAHGLELKSVEADKDRRRLIALELDLAKTQVKSLTLSRDLSRSRASAAALSSRLAANRQAMALADKEATATRERLRRELDAKRAALQAELEQANAAVAQREADLERQRLRTAELSGERDEALARASQRARELDAARAAAEAERDGRLASETQLAQTRARLQKEAARAAEQTRTLEAVKAAGVNVARLNGERPLPLITAVIVHIDAEAAPLEVLVDAGRDSGLEIGDRLYVLRDRRQVACLEVFAVHDEVSATRLVHGERRLRLRAGEDVTSLSAKSP